MISQVVETRLLYEVLGSEFIERSLSHSGLHVGEWKRGHNWVDTDKNLVQEYFNVGVPVTIEMTHMPDGSMVKTRERATFLWEEGFTSFLSWEPTADWLDGIMFRSTLPNDFVVSLISVRQEHTYQGLHSHMFTFDFQPIRWRRRWEHDLDYREMLEIEQTFANVGKSLPRGGVETQINQWSFRMMNELEGKRLQQKFANMGFRMGHSCA
jgi:hypothetical protein